MPGTTLKKISSILNLSISTVSRALKDHPDIAVQTKKKVQELAAMLEYEPNAYAVSLRTNNSRLLGVMIPAISNFFYHSFVASLEEEARKNGYTLMIVQSGDDPIIEAENLRLCKLSRIAGLFVCLTPDTKDINQYLKMEANGTPLIFFDKVPEQECNRICVADEKAAELAAEVLVRKSKTNILALFGNANLSITKKRLSAFTKYFREQGSDAVLHCYHALSSDAARETVLAHLETHQIPDAIFCMSDELLTGAMKVLQQQHISIPEQVAVISISNGFIPTLYYPEITYIETSGAKLAKLALSKMLEVMDGAELPEEVTLEACLVEGGSI